LKIKLSNIARPVVLANLKISKNGSLSIQAGSKLKMKLSNIARPVVLANLKISKWIIIYSSWVKIEDETVKYRATSAVVLANLKISKWIIIYSSWVKIEDETVKYRATSSISQLENLQMDHYLFKLGQN
jgi:hypothetical protein